MTGPAEPPPNGQRGPFTEHAIPAHDAGQLLQFGTYSAIVNGQPVCRLDVVTEFGATMGDLPPDRMIELGLDMLATALFAECDAATYAELTERGVDEQTVVEVVNACRQRRAAMAEARERAAANPAPGVPQ